MKDAEDEVDHKSEIAFTETINIFLILSLPGTHWFQVF